MKTLFVFLCAFVLSTGLFAQKNLNPVIKGFGSLYDVPYARIKADSTMEYKIVVEFRTKLDEPGQMHPNYEHIGRMYNLHIYDRIPQKRLHVAVVIFGPATYSVLNNDAYKAMFKTDNPNLKVFEEFKKAGIKTLVCGQSLSLLQIDPATVSPDVEVASSRFTAVSTYQMKGFALFQLN